MDPERGARVEALIAEMTENARQLLEVLRVERDCLAERRLEGINRAAADKERLARALDTLAAEQVRLLGGGARIEDLPALAHLHPRQARLRELLAQCREQNRSNGASVDLLQRFARRALGVLLGVDGQATVYDPRGQAERAAASRYSTSA